MVGILLSYWDGLFQVQIAVSFREVLRNPKLVSNLRLQNENPGEGMLVSGRVAIQSWFPIADLNQSRDSQVMSMSDTLKFIKAGDVQKSWGKKCCTGHKCDLKCTKTLP